MLGQPRAAGAGTEARRLRLCPSGHHRGRTRRGRGAAGAANGAGGGTHHPARQRWRRRRRFGRGHAARPRRPLAQLPPGNVPLIRRLSRWLRLGAAPIDEDLWQHACQALPWARGLDPERRERLRALATRFLHEKTITPLGGLELAPAEQVLLAALCCLPLLEFGAGGLRGWSQLLVYPDAFRVRRSHVDAAGVLHEWDDELAGEAWDHGPLVLSWADVQADLEEPDTGYCVAVHEMAHKLDVLDGELDGTPPLPAAWHRQWARDFQRAYDGFCAEVDAGAETAIDPYAAEAPEEFFAVATEYHFSAPAVLEQEMPEVAAHLARFYGPSPLRAA